ncbi:MAG: type III pantothenate kinase [Odoribacter splanchnicus]
MLLPRQDSPDRYLCRSKSYYPGLPPVIDSVCPYNYVSAEGVFLGGNISPGLEMRFNGLHRFTARLPLVTPTETYGGIGQSTEEAIRNGVMSGMLFEVQQYIECFLGQYPEGHVLITGGNAHFLKTSDTRIFYFVNILVL